MELQRDRGKGTHIESLCTGDQTQEFTHAGPVCIYGIVPQPDVWKVNTPL